MTLAGYRVPGRIPNTVTLNFQGGADAIPTYSLADLRACVEKGDQEFFHRNFDGKVVMLGTLLDSEESGFPVSNDYGISTVPTMFLLEPDGAVSYVIEGWNKKEIAWLGGKASVNPFRQGDNVPEWKAG